MKTPSLISILGPTASGKTSLAVTVAKQISGEVIGLDSRQIYIDMEIGTAQPSKVEMDGIPHHLIGFRSPTQSVSAGEYAKMVTGIVDKIQGRGNNPIICGGAGLYYRALTEGIFSGSKSDLAVREDLNKEYDELGGEILLDRLKTVDPEYAGITHPNNRKRLVRALEIYLSTGKTPSEHFLDQKSSTGNTIRPFSVWLNVEMDYLE